MHTSTTSFVQDAERRFFAVLCVASLAAVAAGFAASYYLRPFAAAIGLVTTARASRVLPVIVHVHASLFTAWMVLLLVQCALVVRGDVLMHRRVGRIGAALVPVMLLTGIATATTGARDGWNPGGPYRDSLSFMFVGIADLAIFAFLTTAGLVQRSRPDVHKRLMILGTVGGLMWPAITRMPFVAGRLPMMLALLAAFVLAPATRDLLIRSRHRWLTLGVGLAILVTVPLRVAVANSPAWRAVAAWMVR